MQSARQEELLEEGQAFGFVFRSGRGIRRASAAVLQPVGFEFALRILAVLLSFLAKIPGTIEGVQIVKDSDFFEIAFGYRQCYGGFGKQL
jgi:hypothetical protein